MPIAVSCACGKRFEVPDDFAGRQGACTGCGASLMVPAAGAAPSPAPAAAPGGALAPGSKLGEYTLERQLGGPRSTVYLASSPKGQVALKVLPETLIQSDPDAGKRFLREARALFALSDPHLARCLDAGEELGSYYLAMDYVEGRTLRELLREQGGRLGEDEALDIVVQLARALKHLAEHGLVHRHLMPEHVLITPEERVVLVGLGLVRETAGKSVTIKGTVLGTPQYMPPEQARGDEIDARADLYTLGIVLYELLAGGVPFDDKVATRVLLKLASEPPPPLPEKNPAVSAGTWAVVQRLLAKDPAERYPSASELLGDLVALQSDDLIGGLPPFLARGGRPAGAAAAPTTGSDEQESPAGAPRAAAGDPILVKLGVAAGLALGLLVVLLLLLRGS